MNEVVVILLHEKNMFIAYFCNFHDYTALWRRFKIHVTWQKCDIA